MLPANHRLRRRAEKESGVVLTCAGTDRAPQTMKSFLGGLDRAAVSHQLAEWPSLIGPLTAAAYLPEGGLEFELV